MAIFPGAVASNTDLYLVSNNLANLLSAGIDDTVTTIPVISTTGFPTTGWITIDQEAITYTGVTANSFTGATRGAGGTVAASHLISAAVKQTVVAAHHNSLKDETIAIETFLNAKMGTSGAAYTASKALQSNGSGIIEVSAVTTTELGYLSGVTSAIQTQLGTKASTALSNLASVAINTTLVSDTDNTDDLGTSSIAWKDIFLKGALKSAGSTLATVTELGYISGVTSAIQTQLNAKATDSLVAHLAGTETLTGTKIFSATTGNRFHGDASNSAVAAGDIGEVIESTYSAVSLPATGDYSDATSISLTAGKWIVCHFATASANGATHNQTRIGISTTSGNSSSGLTDGTTMSRGAGAVNGVTGNSYNVSALNVKLSGTTTYYAKISGDFSVATPTISGRITAVRVG